MKLLIITQVIDTQDPVLGFFHEWIARLAPTVESVEAVCLQEGEHSLPENVRVHSLGKEMGVGRFTYILRFYYYLWTLRRGYDAVFVHMNQDMFCLVSPRGRYLVSVYICGETITEVRFLRVLLLYSARKYSAHPYILIRHGTNVRY